MGGANVLLISLIFTGVEKSFGKYLHHNFLANSAKTLPLSVKNNDFLTSGFTKEGSLSDSSAKTHKCCKGRRDKLDAIPCRGMVDFFILFSLLQ
jgi:hypothetical protein